MAISFVQEKKKQKYLILILLLVVVITAGVIWWGFFKKEKPPIVTSPSSSSWGTVEIDFKVLEDPLLKDLKVFEKISPFEGQAGKENPFSP